ncbi:MAG: hypothetical protein IJ012_00210 [Clostridia bacterium]|nr:hypothetical protein [Clostridia bacterium]
MSRKRFAALLAALLLLPSLICPLGGCADRLARDLAACDYFAMTDIAGEEYVYAPGEPLFDGAVDVFARAQKTDAPPAWREEGMPSLLLEWIRDESARQYWLYLSPANLAAYLVDAEGAGYALDDTGVAFFLTSPAAAPSLVGVSPPAVYEGGTAVAFSVSKWTYSGTLGGEPFSVASAEYLNKSAEDREINPETFSLTFASTPKNEKYTLYRGAEEIASGEAPPALTALATGEYQLVLVAEWETGNTTTRAGYSFVFTVG